VLPSEDGYFRALVRPAAFLIRFTLAADTLNSAAIADADFFSFNAFTMPSLISGVILVLFLRTFGAAFFLMVFFFFLSPPRFSKQL